MRGAMGERHFELRLTHVGLNRRSSFGGRTCASDVTDVLRVASSHVHDRRLHCEPLAVGLLKATLAAFAEDERELITGAPGVM